MAFETITTFPNKSEYNYNVVDVLSILNNTCRKETSRCLDGKIINALAIKIESNLKIKVRLKPIFDKLELIFNEGITNKEFLIQTYKAIRSIISKKDDATRNIYELNKMADSLIYYENAYSNVDPMTGTLLEKEIQGINYISEAYEILLEGNTSLDDLCSDDLDISNIDIDETEYSSLLEEVKTKEDFLSVIKEYSNPDFKKLYVLTNCISKYIQDIKYCNILNKLIQKKAYKFIESKEMLSCEFGMLALERSQKGRDTSEIRESILFMLEFPFFFGEIEKLKSVFHDGFTRKSYQGGGNYGIILKTTNDNKIDIVKKVSRNNTNQLKDYAKHKVFLDFLIDQKKLGNVSKRIFIPDVFQLNDRLEFKWINGKTLLRIEIEQLLLKKKIMTKEDQINFTLISDQHLFHYFYQKNPNLILENLDLNKEIDAFFAKGFQNMVNQEKRIKNLLDDSYRKDFSIFFNLCKDYGLNNVDFANPANIIISNNGRMNLFDLDNADILTTSPFYKKYKVISNQN